MDNSIFETITFLRRLMFNSDITRGRNGEGPFVLERRGLHKGGGEYRSSWFQFSE